MLIDRVEVIYCDGFGLFEFMISLNQDFELGSFTSEKFMKLLKMVTLGGTFYYCFDIICVLWENKHYSTSSILCFLFSLTSTPLVSKNLWRKTNLWAGHV